MNTYIYIEDMIVKIDKEKLLFKVESLNSKNEEISKIGSLDVKSYINYWNIEGKYILFSTSNGYFLISKYISYFTYEHLIKDASLDSNERLSILSEKGILRIIKDNYSNYFMVEIFNIFDIKHNEKISDIMKKNNFRYIPFVIDFRV